MVIFSSMATVGCLLRDLDLFPNRIKYKIKPKSVLFACFLMRDKKEQRWISIVWGCFLFSCCDCFKVGKEPVPPKKKKKALSEKVGILIDKCFKQR